jgi:5-methylcytosine-specific restriction enzyme A
VPLRIATFKPALPASISRHQAYDHTQRDQEARAFYNSGTWIKLRRMHLRAWPLCVMCQAQGNLTPATHVHHIAEVLANAEARLDDSNLQSLCHSHHSALHARKLHTCMHGGE